MRLKGITSSVARRIHMCKASVFIGFLCFVLRHVSCQLALRDFGLDLLDCVVQLLKGWKQQTFWVATPSSPTAKAAGVVRAIKAKSVAA